MYIVKIKLFKFLLFLLKIFCGFTQGFINASITKFH